MPEYKNDSAICEIEGQVAAVRARLDWLLDTDRAGPCPQ